MDRFSQASRRFTSLFSSVHHGAGHRLAGWLAAVLAPMLAVAFTPAVARAEAPEKDRPAAVGKDAPAKDGAKRDALDTEPAEWLRFVTDKKGGGKLEVASADYRNDNGVTVHLVGAVHIADPSYYKSLSKDFDKYEVLLYELVKPANEGAPAPGAAPRSMIGMFQRFLQQGLELEFQLDGIDYSKKNFVHADLDAETFARMQAEKGESLLSIMLAQMVRDMARQMEGNAPAQPQVDVMGLIDAFNSPDRARQFKLILAQGMSNLEEQSAMMQGTVILTERNKKALEVLRNQVRGGKKDIGIFYGAAHMPDMESRLALMGFKRVSHTWHTAWDLTAKDPDAQPRKDNEKAE